jgi:FMN phosphatase YigB (HAD superfamily)
MIGDSHEADILGALHVGMHAIHFAIAGETPHKDCVMIDELEKILEIL